jgi:hypothetical protein
VHSLFDTGPEAQPVVLSYGLGVDSTALLLRWLEEAGSRDFELDKLVVLTAITGDEFPDTVRLVTSHILHRLRHYRIRYVQVARRGPSQSAGIIVHTDTRTPRKVHATTPYALSDELLAAGTVPQFVSGQRRCTHHFKGFPLTAWTNQEFGSQPIRQVLGYNADEQRRVLRAEGYTTDARHFEFPLIAWGWGREDCERYVEQITGESWRKSCCVFCPFAAGKPEVLARYRQFPAEAADALFLEYVSMTLNERMTLYPGRSLRSVLETTDNTEALRLLEARLRADDWHSQDLESVAECHCELANQDRDGPVVVAAAVERLLGELHGLLGSFSRQRHIAVDAEHAHEPHRSLHRSPPFWKRSDGDRVPA